MATKKKSLVGKVLEIKWEDAWSHDGTWTKPEVEETEELIMTLYGMCVRDDARGITVTMELNPDRKRCRIIWFVPRSLIRKIKVLK